MLCYNCDVPGATLPKRIECFYSLTMLEVNSVSVYRILYYAAKNSDCERWAIIPI
jgi:hypothetical protein